jgi:hypothetical protein
MNYYAYFISRHGRKIAGGCLHADSMEDARKRIITNHNVTVLYGGPDRISVPQFYINENHVNIAIWLSAELFAS